MLTSSFIFQSVTESFGTAISSLSTAHLTDGVIRRSKRMMLDTLGVGLLGTSTPVFNVIFQYSKVNTILGLTLHISVYRVILNNKLRQSYNSSCHFYVLL